MLLLSYQYNHMYSLHYINAIIQWPYRNPEIFEPGGGQGGEQGQGG